MGENIYRHIKYIMTYIHVTNIPKRVIGVRVKNGLSTWID
jgi:hypothetical protein